MKELAKFNVINWDFTGDKLEFYDVLPYFRRAYKERVKQIKKFSKSKRGQEILKNNDNYWYMPDTYEKFKKFIKEQSQYQFWGRCEYECIVHGWPTRKNEHKLDIHEQVMANLDVITNILWEEIKCHTKRL